MKALRSQDDGCKFNFQTGVVCRHGFAISRRDAPEP
jgi:hypothetical protein